MSESVILHKGHRVRSCGKTIIFHFWYFIKLEVFNSGSQHLSQQDSFTRHKQAVFSQPLLFATACSKTINFLIIGQVVIEIQKENWG